jgi:putative addiction module component (TIGR02574 family)
MEMERPINQVRASALALSASERASLAHDLIISLDDAEGLELLSAEEAEIGRRVEAVRSGKAAGRNAAVVVSDIRSEYNK